jgi:hypothetical protein
VGTTVKDVTQDMKAVHRTFFNEVTELDDKGVRASGGDNGADDLFVIPLFVVIGVGVEQLVDDIGEIGGDLFPYLGAGILGGDRFTHLDQAVDDDAAPVVELVAAHFSTKSVEGLCRGGDEKGQFFPLSFRYGPGKQRFDFVPNDAGGIGEKVAEGVILPMKVTEKVFRALGKLTDGVEVDDLG